MNFKIDTKEKFSVLQPEIEHLTAIMAGELCNKVLSLSNSQPFNVIIDFKQINQLEKEAAKVMANCRMKMYENNHSFVVCNVQKNVYDAIVAWELEEVINITPTESEAWDIVQMDEIEREFMQDDE
jgi:anti-anti-sigma regulatory factor